MPAKAILPPGAEASARALKLSPGVLSHGHVFLTGMTGSRPDGTMPDALEEQFRAALDKIGTVLAEAGLGFGDLVEMTSYHVGLNAHFDRFSA